MEESSKSITVILNLYKRPEYLEEQLHAIKQQTVKPTEIWLWINSCQENRNFRQFSLFDNVIKSSKNVKYHGRFSAGLLCSSKFLAVFDDDTIPGKDWFSNCLNTMSISEGILGGAGCILNSNKYAYHTRIGWPSMNREVVEVDLVGHAWFLKRDHLNYMWYETPYSLNNCEDMQLSFMAKKHGGVKSFCPPHPEGEKNLWSSLKPWEYGNDKKASSNGSLMPVSDFYLERDRFIENSINTGSKFILL